jgi:hypothetical protein
MRMLNNWPTSWPFTFAAAKYRSLFANKYADHQRSNICGKKPYQSDKRKTGFVGMSKFPRRSGDEPTNST